MAVTRYIEESIGSSNAFWSVRTGNARMGVIRLNDKKLCLVSPLAAVLKETFDNFTVSHLLAPNHYHNKALSEYADRYPRAHLCSSKGAKTRLEEVTSLKFKSLTAIKNKLPKGLTFIEPEGLKTGEIWIKFAVGRQSGWYVIDAFTGRKMSLTNDECDKPEMLKTFPSYGIADRKIYQKWVLQQIKKDKPAIVVPCHGSIVRNPKLPALLEALIESA